MNVVLLWLFTRQFNGLVIAIIAGIEGKHLYKTKIHKEIGEYISKSTGRKVSTFF